jgi:hypothetical protein
VGNRKLLDDFAIDWPWMYGPEIKARTKGPEIKARTKKRG